MAQCSAYKRNGARCTLQVEPPNEVCWAHDPKNAEQRRKRSSKGGRSKASREIKALKKQLEDLANGVLEGRVGRGTVVAVNQILNTQARLIELERKIHEQEELVGRVEALELMRNPRGEGYGWG